MASLCFSALTSAAGIQTGIDSERRPNIVLIVSDDQGFGDLSAMGHPVLKTPNLDRLKSESVWLRRFYAAPLCAPSRAQIMTGRHQFRTGVWDTWSGRTNMATDEKTVADYLHEEGYETGIFGKWHLGENYPFRPHDRGFDVSVIWNNFDRFIPTFSRNGVTTPPQKGFLDDLVTDEAIRFMQQKRGQPFFAYVPLWLPHTFRNKQVPDEYVRLFNDVDDATPLDREIMGMITNVDYNVGRIMSMLRERGLEENTLVVFISDNGLTARSGQSASFNAGLRGRKTMVYEDGIRVPCFIRWPGKLRPQMVEEITSETDILPTFLFLAGGEHLENPIDGQNLWPLLSGQVGTMGPRYFVQQQQPQKSGHSPQPFVNAAVIGQDYKIVFQDGPDSAELYDLIVDEAEQHDLARVRPATVSHLKAYYMRWFADISAGRGFDPIPAILGNPAQVEFRESMIQVSEKDGLSLQVEVAGQYEVELLQVQRDLFPKGGALGLTDGKSIWKGPVSTDTQNVKMTVSLPKGMVRLWGWSAGKIIKGGYVPVGADPGCRQLVIRGPL
jgi:arylsulfatase A-like enzyme